MHIAPLPPAVACAAASAERRRALRVVTPGEGVAAAVPDAAVEAVGDPAGATAVRGCQVLCVHCNIGAWLPQRHSSVATHTSHADAHI